MSEAVLFAYNKGLHTSLMLPGRAALFSMLEERQLRPVVSTGAEEAFSDEGSVSALELINESGEETTREIGRMALHEEVKVIVNRADRSLKLSGLPPMINENATRSLGHRKWDMYTKVLEELGVAIPSHLITHDDATASFVAACPGNQVIVKPQVGTFGKGIQPVDRRNFATAFSENPDWDTTHLVQPAYDVTQPFPSAIRPYDMQERERFESLNVAGVRKELRMYGFYAYGNVEVFPVARSFINNEDNWFFVDPETIPEAVNDGAKAIIRKVAQVSGAAALYGAADYVYGHAGDQDNHWPVMEVNTRAPYIIGFEAHYDAAYKLHSMFADKIAEAGRSSCQ